LCYYYSTPNIHVTHPLCCCYLLLALHCCLSLLALCCCYSTPHPPLCCYYSIFALCYYYLLVEVLYLPPTPLPPPFMPCVGSKTWNMRLRN
jgi:hypothetical protein